MAQFLDNIDKDSEEEVAETIVSQNAKCAGLNCSIEKYSYSSQANDESLKCPDDSSVAQLDENEAKCCNVKNTCACNKCEPKEKMIEWCKLAGNNFEAVLVEKGLGLPGKCCDVHICRKLNFIYYCLFIQNIGWKKN